MTSFAEDFRAEAKAKPGQVVRRQVNGWSFCLSYGAVDPLMAADYAADANLRMKYEGRDVTDEVIKATQEITGTKPDDPRPAFIYDLAMQQHSIGTDMPIPKDDLQWMNEELVKVGNISKPDDLSKVIDPKPREDAFKLIAQMH